MSKSRVPFLFVLIIPVIAFILVYAFRTKVDHRQNENIVLSEFSFLGESGKEYFYQDPTKITIIVWFHPDCERCLYQLNTMNRKIQLLHDVSLLFLTDESSFIKKKYMNKWPGLVESSNVRFGIIDKAEFVNKFGRVTSPHPANI